jgi:hypothetical protein
MSHVPLLWFMCVNQRIEIILCWSVAYRYTGGFPDDDNKPFHVQLNEAIRELSRTETSITTSSARKRYTAWADTVVMLSKAISKCPASEGVQLLSLAKSARIYIYIYIYIYIPISAK